jgi:hypothetical protein
MAPIALALLGLAIVSHFYGTNAVALLLQIPSSVDDGRSGLEVRVTRPDGVLVVRLEEHSRPPTGHTIVAHTKLPRGHYLVEAILDGTRQHLKSSIAFDGEDTLEVLLEPK